MPEFQRKLSPVYAIRWYPACGHRTFDADDVWLLPRFMRSADQVGAVWLEDKALVFRATTDTDGVEHVMQGEYIVEENGILRKYSAVEFDAAFSSVGSAVMCDARPMRGG